MTVNVSLRIQSKELPSDYRPTILSLLKAVLSRSYPEDYARLYELNDSKDFTFAVKFAEPLYRGEQLSFSDEMALLVLSSGDEYLSLLFYNAFCKNLKYQHPLRNGEMLSIESVRILPQPQLSTDTSVIHFLSPLVVRSHTRGEADHYYVFGEPEFSECLQFVVSKQLGRQVDILLEPIAPKKTVTRCYGVNIRCSIGTYRITAEPDVLNALLKNGMGSRRNMGFGMFQVRGG